MSFVSSAEMEKMLGISHNTFKRIIREKQIPHLRVGRQFRFDPLVVIEHLTVHGTCAPTTQWMRRLLGEHNGDQSSDQSQ